MKTIPLLVFLSFPLLGITQIKEFEEPNSAKPSADNSTKAPSANDNCANATSLTINGACVSGTSVDNTVQAGEAAAFPCNAIGGGGVTARSVWYRVNAGTNTSLNFSITRTSGITNCGYHIAVYGPFAVGGGCLPSAAQSVFCDDFLDLYDPGFHFQLNSLTTNGDYLIQVMNEDCGGGNARTINFCMGVYTVPVNNVPSGAIQIDECGVVHNGTNIGYTPSNGAPGLENLDNNSSTTCPTCTAGEEVPYVVNNDSWFTFCAGSNGTWSVDFNNIANCRISQGVQMSILKGSLNNMTLVQHAPSPSIPGSSWSSSVFSVNSGECVFLIVDGFAGDQCNYSYTLNNITGGCNLFLPLPVELLNFYAFYSMNRNELYWTTASEKDNDYFQIERSLDGDIWETISIIDGAGDSNEQLKYSVFDHNFKNDLNYYRLKQVDFNGNYEYSHMISVDNRPTRKQVLKTVNLVGQEVDEYHKGMRIIMYQDGSTTKFVNLD